MRTDFSDLPDGAIRDNVAATPNEFVNSLGLLSAL